MMCRRDLGCPIGRGKVRYIYIHVGASATLQSLENVCLVRVVACWLLACPLGSRTFHEVLA
jgi:hypothetical protein